MRKAAALLLAMALILSLFGCGNESEQPAPDSDIQQGTVILPRKRILIRQKTDSRAGSSPPHRIRCRKPSRRISKNLLTSKSRQISRNRRRNKSLLRLKSLWCLRKNTVRCGSPIWNWAGC